MRRLAVLALVVSGCAGCAGGGGGGGPADVTADVPGDAPAEAADDAVADAPPEAFTFHAIRQQPAPVKDEAYGEDYATFYPAPGDVRALVVLEGPGWEGALYAGGPAGLFRFDEAADAFVKVRDGEVIDVADLEHVVGTEVPGATSIATSAAGTWVGTDTGLLAWDAGTKQYQPVPATAGLAIRDVAALGAKVYLATSQGLGVLEGATLSWLKAADGSLPDDDVRAVAVHGESARIVAGCSTGIADIGAGVVRAGKGGLPTGDVRAASVYGALMVLGHQRGATFGNVGLPGYRHYVSGRWLPDDRVQAAAVGWLPGKTGAGDISLWLGTPKGVSRIRLRNATLAGKAEAVFQKVPHFWRMDGFVAPDARVDDGRNPSKWDPLWDSDNDGLWTQMAIGAFCYAYAVTKDERYYQAARKAMDTMFLEIDVPAADFQKAGLGRGFVTRSLIRDDEGALFDSHATETRWHLVTHTDGRSYYWKDDTSSDETTGHFFGYPLFYDLCAKDDAERAAVAEHAGALASYIIDGGYTLRDLDGQPTSFGHWEPSLIAIAVDGLPACAEAGNSIEDCAYAAFGGGWLNGIEILGHMLAAWHMTGDPKFKAAYEELCTTHRYCEAVRFHDQIATVVSPRIANHSDHELAMLAYHTLIRYEPDDARRAMWVADLLAFWAWESGGVAGAGNERQPLWAAFVALATGGEGRAEAFAEAAQSLREYPGDLVSFRFDNTHRKDAGDWPPDRFDDPQFDTVFPYDEIAQMWWNGNPYNKAEGGDGRSLQGPMAFLLAYWAQRYSGLLQ